jgi:quercetin dioxygenase-like cupin family protein
MHRFEENAMSTDPVSPHGGVIWLDTTYFVKLTAQESGGSIGVFETLAPVGSGPPIHVHHGEDEVLHILEGQIESWLDGELTTFVKGDTAFLPRGVPHTFRVTGDTPVRLLVILTPGGFEGFFPAVAAKGCRIPEDMAELAALAATYKLEFLGPPPWA